MLTARDPRRANGFTLVELIVVLGILSILMGVGIGFLQRGGTDVDVAMMVVRDQIRLAATTAGARNLPTAVYVDPGQDGRAARMHVRGLRSVGAWHFEDDERWFDERLRPDLGGSKAPGRYGQGRRSNPDEGVALLSVAADRDLFDVDDGFAVRVEIMLDAREPMIVARMGEAFELLLQEDLRPLGQVRLQGVGDALGETVRVQGLDPLPTGQWLTLELVHDGREVTLFVDGQALAHEDASGAPLRRNGDAFEVSPAAGPVHGVVDEVQLLAYERGEDAVLPFGVEWIGVPGPIRFDRRGQLVAPVPARVGVSLNDEIVERVIAPGGVLQ